MVTSARSKFRDSFYIFIHVIFKRTQSQKNDNRPKQLFYKYVVYLPAITAK